MPYWIISTLAATPALLWMFGGLGLPYALLMLPRRDWRDPAIVGCVTLAFGPALLTVWMFILGVIGGAQQTALITLPNVLIGTGLLAVTGWFVVIRKFRATGYQPPATNHQSPITDHQPPATSHRPLTILLIALIALALIIRWLGVAYWPSTAYDARWVYAYQGELYALKGFIPPEIGYYPPFLALQHTWLHLAVGGVDDHAARAVLPWLHLGSILAAYTLGRLLFTRRVGLYLAAIWALYPHLGEWSRYGDLEVPVAFLFTAAVAFYLKAAGYQPPASSQNRVHSSQFTVYSEDQKPSAISYQLSASSSSLTTDHQPPATAYALIAGLLLGIGLWTKPTMGAFIWGVMQVVAAGVVWQWARKQVHSEKPLATSFQLPASSQKGDSAEYTVQSTEQITAGDTHPADDPKTLSTQHLALSTPQKLSAISYQLFAPLLTALACLPLGATWYVRNIALGHNPVDFPPGIWLDRAARSGVEFGWPLLALVMGVAYLLWSRYRELNTEAQRLYRDSQRLGVGTPFMSSVFPLHSHLRIGWILAGTGLILLATLPTILQPARMGLLEWAALLAGVGLIGYALWRWLPQANDEQRRPLGLLGAAGLLALPYFVTWFYSYSYHYRLSFAIVPLMILPTAVILARWTEKLLPQISPSPPPQTALERGQGGGVLRLLMGIVITVLAVPGIINPLYDPNAGWDWLWTDKLPDDHARHRSGNEALMAVVDGLQIYLDTHDPQTQPLRVVAPGALQLPFFFPLEDIRTGPMPSRISDLDGVTYFIYGVPESGGDFSTFIMGVNPVLDLLGRAVEGEDDLRAPLRRAWWADDGIFQFNVYELHLDRRFTEPKDYAPVEGDVTFGGVVRLLGYDLVGLEFWQGRPMWMHLYWQVLEPTDRDLFTYVHLMDKDGNLIRSWDGPVSWRDDGFRWDATNYYSSRVWEPGEYIVDRRIPRLTDPIPPLGDGNRLVIGLYDAQTNERLPMFVDGQPAGDGWTMPQNLSVIASPE
jgi:hypothetical protein